MVGYLKQNNNVKKKQNQKYTQEGKHENMDNKKQEQQSVIDELLDMGIKKALGLIWLIYTIVYIIAMFMVYWFSKNSK